MTLDEFVVANNGQYREVAGSTAPYQCVDLANLYIRDVLKLPIIEWTNATDFPSKAGDKYEYILNTPTNAPIAGDIIVWSGDVGHIAVVISATANKITSFDQNYPTGTPCHIQNHNNYVGVKGWLRAKPQVTQPAFVWTAQTKIPINITTPLETYNEVQLDTLQGKLRAKDTTLAANNSAIEKITEDAKKLTADYGLREKEWSEKLETALKSSLAGATATELFNELLKRLNLKS